MTDAPQFQMSADTKIIRSVFDECEIGQLVTYEELTAAIGRDVREFARGSIATVRKALLKERRVVFECVQDQGYMRLNDSEIVASTERDRGRLYRASSRVIRKLGCVSFDKLADSEKVSHTVACAQFGAMQMFAKKSSAKRLEAKAKEESKPIAIGDTLKLFS